MVEFPYVGEVTDQGPGLLIPARHTNGDTGPAGQYQHFFKARKGVDDLLKGFTFADQSNLHAKKDLSSVRQQDGHSPRYASITVGSFITSCGDPSAIFFP